MGENSRNDFVQAFVLAQGLTEHSPERDEWAKDTAAIGVAFGFENAKDVFPTQEPTKRQAGIVGKLVPNDAEVSAWHGGFTVVSATQSA